MSQVLNFLEEQLTFLRFDREPVIHEAAENRAQVLDVSIKVGAKYANIIDEDRTNGPVETTENHVHNPGKVRRRVAKPKGNRFP